MRVRSEIDHIGNRLRDCRIDRAHNEHAKEVEECRHQNCRARLHTSGRYAGCNRIRTVRPAVDENHAEGQTDCQHQKRVGCYLFPEIDK